MRPRGGAAPAQPGGRGRPRRGWGRAPQTPRPVPPRALPGYRRSLCRPRLRPPARGRVPPARRSGTNFRIPPA
ncbi:hypothetical protein HGM15179_016653, partial [Zosterops borbonicus]